MIAARFGLKKLPFSKSISTRDLYPSPGLKELTERLEMSKSARGVMLLTGDPGLGKTVQSESSSTASTVNDTCAVICLCPR